MLMHTLAQGSTVVIGIIATQAVLTLLRVTSSTILTTIVIPGAETTHMSDTLIMLIQVVLLSAAMIHMIIEVESTLTSVAIIQVRAFIERVVVVVVVQ